MAGENSFELATFTARTAPATASTIPPASVHTNACRRFPLAPLSPMIAPASVTKSPLSVYSAEGSQVDQATVFCPRDRVIVAARGLAVAGDQPR